MNFITKLGPSFVSQVDYYGNNYIDLLYTTVYKVVKDCLTGPSDTEIILALRLVICVLEQSKDKWQVPRFEEFLDVALSLSEWKRTDKLAMNILQTVSMFVWHSPVRTIAILKDKGKLEAFYTELVEKLDQFHDEAGVERVLFGMISLLEMSHSQAQVALVYHLVHESEHNHEKYHLGC